MSNLFDKQKLERNVDLQILKPLLLNIKEEEPYLTNELKDKFDFPSVDFTKSFVVLSNKQVYKSYSLVGLTKYHTRYTKYELVNLAIFLDIWYNQSEDYSKSILLNTDILILYGNYSNRGLDNKVEAISDLITMRKNSNKLTWLFIVGPNTASIKNKYEPTIKAAGSMCITKL